MKKPSGDGLFVKWEAREISTTWQPIAALYIHPNLEQILGFWWHALMLR
jgi:hypothetical protein